MSSTAAALPDKTRLAGALRKHFFLRVHMFVILGGTFSVGLLTTKILLITHERSLAFRYGLAVVIAFVAFLAFIKLWLKYVAHCASHSRSSSEGDWTDLIDFDCDGVSGGSSAADLPSGGGNFGGGGASGSWGDAQVVAPVPSPGHAGGGWSLGDIDFGDDLGVVILVAVLVVVIALAALWVIWAAPAILSEAAFQATLAATLTRRAKKLSNGTWVGSVVKSTVLPFLAVLAIAVTLGWYAQKHCPTATRLRDALHCVAR